MRFTLSTTGGINVDPAVRLDAAVERALRVAGENILNVSNDRAPIETGDMIRSGKVTVDKVEGDASITYDREYATRQHEDLTLRHANGRQAKFLESAINDERDNTRKIIARGVAKALGTD